MSHDETRKPSLSERYSSLTRPKTAGVWQTLLNSPGRVKNLYTEEIDALFCESPELMNTLTFGAGSWTLVEGPARAQMLPGLDAEKAVADRWSSALWIRVRPPFFVGVHLWEFVFTTEKRVVWLLEGPTAVMVLDGTDNQLLQGNWTFSLRLNEETVGQYLKYYYVTTPTEEMLGVQLDSHDHPLWRRHWTHRMELPEIKNWLFAPRVLDTVNAECIAVRVCELDDRRLVHTVYRVYPSGVVERDDESNNQLTLFPAHRAYATAQDLDDVGDSRGAIENLSSCLRILRATEADEALDSTDLLGKALRFRGRLYHSLGDVNAAIVDFWNFAEYDEREARAWDPFRSELAEMSAKTFGEGALIKESEVGFSPSNLAVYRCSLPFYPHALLWHVEATEPYPVHKPLWYLQYAGRFLFLDATSAPIHEANESPAFALNESTVVPYLKFFCTFVEAEEGPFYIVEDAGHPVVKHHAEALGPAVETIQPATNLGEKDGKWYVKAHVLYGGELSNAVFEIAPDGCIEMT